ncbi:MAG: hypothetical protein Q8M09_05860 [Pseudomonadota bacterium]|nr:hypothetical protein [Pseudomonadota bacterium]
MLLLGLGASLEANGLNPRAGGIALMVLVTEGLRLVVRLSKEYAALPAGPPSTPRFAYYDDEEEEDMHFPTLGYLCVDGTPAGGGDEHEHGGFQVVYR